MFNRTPVHEILDIATHAALNRAEGRALAAMPPASYHCGECD